LVRFPEGPQRQHFTDGQALPLRPCAASAGDESRTLCRAVVILVYVREYGVRFGEFSGEGYRKCRDGYCTAHIPGRHVIILELHGAIDGDSSSDLAGW
jgi:hypothetical protein